MATKRQKGDVVGAGKKDRKKRLRLEASRPEHWKDAPDGHDFPAAASYLGLTADGRTIEALVLALRSAPTLHAKAKDLLRASRLPLLGTDNAHVVADLDKVRGGEPLSPVLLVRGALRHDRPLTVADGYHRICASYHLDENADIPYRIVDLPPVEAGE